MAMDQGLIPCHGSLFVGIAFTGIYNIFNLNIMRPGEHYCSGIRDDGNNMVHVGWDIYDRIRDCTIVAIS